MRTPLAAPMPDRAPPRIGERFAGRFKLLERLRGEGAAHVYLALDDYDREVAVLAVDAARCNPVDWGVFIDVIAYASEAQIPGLDLFNNISPASAPPHCLALTSDRSLEHLRRDEGLLPWRRVLALGEALATILAAVESTLGIAHRALCPARIILSSDENLKILDYGVAEIQPLASPDDATHCAPEQRRGPGDHRSDIYSLAAILYELITGQRPFPGFAPRLRSSIREAPQIVDDIFKRALDPDPDQRYPDVASLRAALQEALESDAPAVTVQPLRDTPPASSVARTPAPAPTQAAPAPTQAAPAPTLVHAAPAPTPNEASPAPGPVLFAPAPAPAHVAPAPAPVYAAPAPAPVHTAPVFSATPALVPEPALLRNHSPTLILEARPTAPEPAPIRDNSPTLILEARPTVSEPAVVRDNSPTLILEARPTIVREPRLASSAPLREIRPASVAPAPALAPSATPAAWREPVHKDMLPFAVRIPDEPSGRDGRTLIDPPDIRRRDRVAPKTASAAILLDTSAPVAPMSPQPHGSASPSNLATPAPVAPVSPQPRWSATPSNIGLPAPVAPVSAQPRWSATPSNIGLPAPAAPVSPQPQWSAAPSNIGLPAPVAPVSPQLRWSAAPANVTTPAPVAPVSPQPLVSETPANFATPAPVQPVVAPQPHIVGDIAAPPQAASFVAQPAGAPSIPAVKKPPRARHSPLAITAIVVINLALLLLFLYVLLG